MGKRKSRAKRGRREFLKWTALGWIGSTLADKVAGKVFDRGWDSVFPPPTTAKRDTVIALEPARMPWTGTSFAEVYGRRDSRPLNSLTPPA